MFVRVESETYRIHLAHLDLSPTVARLPAEAFLPGFTPDAGALARQFATLRDFRVATAVAQWSISKGDIAGFSGDTGYSEAPHLHYTISHRDGDVLLAPTAEAGFRDGGWLF